jgi:hypothetical protein
LAWLARKASEEERATFGPALLDAARARRYRTDPVGWVQDKLGEFLWSKQRQIMESVRDHRRTAVRSSHGPGKSRVASRVVSWWLDTHEPGTAFAATSAPTQPQVRGVLWREINDAHRKGHLIGRVNQTEWLVGNELIGFGRKPADPAEGGTDETVTAFHGQHAPYMLVVLDEAGGIPGPLWAAAKSLITGRNNRILAIGNPDDPTSEFEKICRPGSGWNVITISTFDTPNFTGEDVPDALREVLPDRIWLEEFIRDYGEGSNLYLSKVLGEFPKDVSDAVVPYSWAYQCTQMEGRTVNPDKIVSLGCDIGAGVDETVITPMQDRKFMPQRRSRHDDPMKAVGEIVNAIREYRNWPIIGEDGVRIRVNIDAIGVGWGVAGRVKEVCEENGWTDVEVNAVKVSEQASKPDQYKNLRAELWWGAREACHDKLWDLTEVDDHCINELTTPKWSENSSGQIEVEKREKIVARLKRSPDNASSLILAPFVPPKSNVGEEVTVFYAAGRRR